MKEEIQEPVMVSGEDELEMDAIFISSLKNLLGLYWINNCCFFRTLIDDPVNQSIPHLATNTNPNSPVFNLWPEKLNPYR